MIKEIIAVYTDSVNPDFGFMEESAIMLTDDLLLDNHYAEDEAVIFVMDKPVLPDSNVVHIDRATCRRFHINFFGMDDEVDFEFTAKCRFVDLVRTFAGVPK